MILSRGRLLAALAVLVGTCTAASATGQFSIDSYDIDVGQDGLTDVAIFGDGLLALAMLGDGPVRLRLIDAKNHVIVGSPNDFEQDILPSGGAVVGHDVYLACYYGLFILDAQTGKRATIYEPEPIQGGVGSGVVVSSDTRRAYAIVAGELLAVDTVQQQVVAQTTLESEDGYDLAISRNNREIYVIDWREGLLSRFDAGDLSEIGSSEFAEESGIEARPVGVAVAPSGSIYIGYSNQEGQFRISILDKRGAPVGTKAYPWSSTGLAMTPDGTYLITGTGEVIVRKTLDYLGRPRAPINGGRPHVSRDGKRAFLPNGNRLVTILDLTSIPRLVPVDVRPEGIEVPALPDEPPVLPVAILSKPGFQPRSVLPESMCFGSAQAEDQRWCGKPRVIDAKTDLNEDNVPDLLVGFPESLPALETSDPEACLTATTASGAHIAGCDQFRGEESVPGIGIGPQKKKRKPPTPGSDSTPPIDHP